MGGAATGGLAQRTRTVQMYRVNTRATPQTIRDAITKPEWTMKYAYATPVGYDLRPGGEFRAYANEGMKAMGCPDVISDGEVTEAVRRAVWCTPGECA